MYERYTMNYSTIYSVAVKFRLVSTNRFLITGRRQKSYNYLLCFYLLNFPYDLYAADPLVPSAINSIDTNQHFGLDRSLKNTNLVYYNNSIERIDKRDNQE